MINVNDMKKLFLLPFICLLSCRQKDLPSDAASRASGVYTVQSYVVDGDTLYSTNGKNMLRADDFRVEIDRKSPDSVAIAFSLFRNLKSPPSRIVHVDEMGRRFEFSDSIKSPFVYESRIDGNKFYERTVSYNADTLYARWHLDSLKNPFDPVPLKEVVITAQKR